MAAAKDTAKKKLLTFPLSAFTVHRAAEWRCRAIDTPREQQISDKSMVSAPGKAFFHQTWTCLRERGLLWMPVSGKAFQILLHQKINPQDTTLLRNQGSSVLPLTKWPLCKSRQSAMRLFTHIPFSNPITGSFCVFHCIFFTTQEKIFTSTEDTLPGIWISFA